MNETDRLDRRAIANGIIASALLVLAIFAGSRMLRHFDPALITYTVAIVFANFGIVYRYSVWLQKPPTRVYWRRGWQLFLRPAKLPANLFWLIGLIWKNVILQTFIDRRSHLRW